MPIRQTLKTNTHILKAIFERTGIKILGQIVYKNTHTKASTIVYEKNSAPVLDLVTSALEYSNNLFMETLLLEASSKQSLLSAAKSMRSFLHARFPALKLNEVFFENGSGLSVRTKLMPWQIAKFLEQTKFTSYNGKSFMSILSLAGHSGFLAKKFLNDRAYQTFFAKTGSLDYVNGLCGVSTDQYMRSFCIFINHFEKRQKLNGKNSEELNELREQAKGWKRTTDQVLERVLETII